MFSGKKTFILFMLVLGLLILTLSGCGGGGTKTAEKGTAQELVIGYGRDLNVVSVKQSGEMLLNRLAGERLVDIVDGKVIPALAASWDIKDEGKEIVFHLRKDVKFSDGSAFTADAVKFSFDRLKKMYGDSYGDMAGVKVIDPYTVSIQYKKGGYVNFEQIAGSTSPTIFSPASAEPKGDPAGKFVQAIGTGPWKVAEYVKDQYTVLVPNEHYYGPKPKLSKITVKAIPDDKARVLALRSGEIDVVVDSIHGGLAYTPRHLVKALKEEGYQIYEKEMPMTIVLAFNFKKEPWNNPKVRMAVNHAINKDELSLLFANCVNPAKEGLFSHQLSYTANQPEQYTYDTQQTQKLLTEAGYSNGINTELMVKGENADWIKVAEIIQSQLKKVGINANISAVEGGAHTDRLKKGEYDLFIYYIGGPEPWFMSRLQQRFYSVVFHGSPAYASQEMDLVVDKAINTFKEEERFEALKQFYSMAKKDAVVVPLYYERLYVITKPKVKGIEFISSEPRFENVYLAKD